MCWPLLFAYVADFIFLRDVWIRTQRAAVASSRAIPTLNPYLATHIPNLATHFPVVILPATMAASISGG